MRTSLTGRYLFLDAAVRYSIVSNYCHLFFHLRVYCGEPRILNRSQLEFLHQNAKWLMGSGIYCSFRIFLVPARHSMTGLYVKLQLHRALLLVRLQAMAKHRNAFHCMYSSPRTCMALIHFQIHKLHIFHCYMLLYLHLGRHIHRVVLYLEVFRHQYFSFHLSNELNVPSTL